MVQVVTLDLGLVALSLDRGWWLGPLAKIKRCPAGRWRHDRSGHDDDDDAGSVFV